jgi:hypothetical protein
MDFGKKSINKKAATSQPYENNLPHISNPQYSEMLGYPPVEEE